MRSLRLIKRITFSVVVLILVGLLTRTLIYCFYDQPLTQSQKIIILDKSESYSGNVVDTLNNETRPMKYILQWTSPKNVPLVFMGEGQKGFIERGCPYTNCYVTGNKRYLDDITKYDVVAFSGPEVIRLSQNSLPTKRSSHQKYVFASIESSDYYPVCSNKYDGYFNWTWTFRLDSEVRWGYFNIWDKNGNIVGPNKIMHWIKLEDMEPISDGFKKQLRTKTKAAAWFVSNCVSKSKREKYTKDLQKALQKYNLVVDVYGKCGPLKCDRSKEKDCNQMLKEQYYFYLSFENSFSEDYVTEKLLNAVENDAVPIVFGAANYTRYNKVQIDTTTTKKIRVCGCALVEKTTNHYFINSSQ